MKPLTRIIFIYWYNGFFLNLNIDRFENIATITLDGKIILSKEIHISDFSYADAFMLNHKEAIDKYINELKPL